MNKRRIQERNKIKVIHKSHRMKNNMIIKRRVTDKVRILVNNPHKKPKVTRNLNSKVYKEHKAMNLKMEVSSKIGIQESNSLGLISIRNKYQN